jgi:hypothetical protein
LRTAHTGEHDVPDLSDERKQQIRAEEEARLRAEQEAAQRYREDVRKERQAQQPDWVLVWVVLVPVMLGLLGWVVLLGRETSYGIGPARTVMTILRHRPSGLMLPAPLLAGLLAMVLLSRLQARGVNPMPTIVLTVVAWCVLTVAMWSAIAGFGLLAIGFLSA